MRRKEEILAEINADVPFGVDWLAGAKRYVAAAFDKHNRGGVERYSLTKPMYALDSEGYELPLLESLHYLQNFANTLKLLKLPGGSRVLDVACGGGWYSHYMARMGYVTSGFDVSSDFIGLARRRLAEDPYLDVASDDLEARFFVHDIESSPLPDRLRGSFDAIVLESCLHHFYDPIAALTHIAAGLRENGVVVIIEGENRTGPLLESYQQVMREFETLERPYPRSLLEEVMQIAGLRHYEFVAPINGFFSLNDPDTPYLLNTLQQSSDAMNVAICASSEHALKRVFSWRGAPSPVSATNDAPAAASNAPEVASASPVAIPGWLARLRKKLQVF